MVYWAILRFMANESRSREFWVTLAAVLSALAALLGAIAGIWVLIAPANTNKPKSLETVFPKEDTKQIAAKTQGYWNEFVTLSHRYETQIEDLYNDKVSYSKETLKLLSNGSISRTEGIQRYRRLAEMTNDIGDLADEARKAYQELSHDYVDPQLIQAVADVVALMQSVSNHHKGQASILHSEADALERRSTLADFSVYNDEFTRRGIELSRRAVKIDERLGELSVTLSHKYNISLKSYD